jgi:1,4-alpha-glucan branching enzyme
VRVRPLTATLAAAVIATLLLLPRAQQNPSLPTQQNPIVQTVSAGAPEVYVQFVFAAPNAQTVAVAGDFNSWQTNGVALRDADGDGVWTGLVALRPGAHKYMFIVNGKEWVTDPGAERYVDDGFGMRNAVINVAAPARSL